MTAGAIYTPAGAIHGSRVHFVLQLQGKLFAVDQIVDGNVKIIGHAVQKRKGGLALARFIIGKRLPCDMQVHRHLLLAQTALFPYLPQALHIDKIVTFCYIQYVTICYKFHFALNGWRMIYEKTAVNFTLFGNVRRAAAVRDSGGENKGS